MESNPEGYIQSFINYLRTTPLDATNDIEQAAQYLSNSEKAKLSEFCSKLQFLDHSPPLKLSHTLTKSAEDKMKLIHDGKEESESEKKARINRNCVGYTEMIEIYHHGTMDMFPAEFFSSEQDPKRYNRQTIFENKYRYIGLAIDKDEQSKKKEHHFLIVLSDRIIEDNNKPLDQQIVEVMNEFRKAPIRKAEELLEIKGSKDFVENISQFVSRLSSKPLPPIERHEYIDEVAKNIYEKIQSNEYNDPSDEETLADIAHNTIHHFQRIHFGYVKNIKNTQEIIMALLANPKEKNSVLFNTRKIINGKNIKYIGCHYIGHGEKTNSMVIVAVDEFKYGSKKEYSEYFSQEINRLRLNPSSYVNDLSVYNKEIKIRTYKHNLIAEIKELQQKLKVMEPIGELKNHPLLNKICEEYACQINKLNRLSNEDDDMLEERLKLEVSGFSIAKLFVHNKASRPESFITNLLISEEDSERTSRKILLSNEYKYFGCFYVLHGDSRFSVVVLLDNVEEREFKPINEEIIDRINLTRIHPRSLIKFVNDYEIELKHQLSSATQSTYTSRKKKADNKVQQLEEKIGFAGEVREYLNNAKIRSKLQRNYVLIPAIKDLLYSEDPKALLEDVDLRDYIKKYANNSFYSGMLTGSLEVSMFSEEGDSNVDKKDEKSKGRFMSGYFLAKTIIDQKSIELLRNIFAFPFSYLEVSIDFDTDNVIGLFSDHAVEKIPVDVPLDVRQKVKRPEFSHDELEQLRNDFNRLDILNEGFVRPDTIVTFMSNSLRFINNNPIYYTAFRNLNTIENNENGINVNQFMDAVTEVIALYGEHEWENVYNLITKDSIQRTFDKKMYVDTVKALGYKVSETEAGEMFERFSNEKSIISKNDFIKMMFMAEKGIFSEENLKGYLDKTEEVA